MENLVSQTFHIIHLDGQYLSDYDFLPVMEEVEEQLASDCNYIAIDLSKLKFMNSTGLGALIRILTKSRTAGGEAVLLHSNPQIEQLLLMTKLNKVFNTFDSIEAVQTYFDKNNQ